MKRKIYNELLAWKEDSNKKPLMLLGARQVGKTYIIREFCQNNFKNFIEVNLFNRSDIVDLYNSNRNSLDKYNLLKGLVNFNLDEDDTVLFIDEIQESEKLISELKYFCEDHNNLYVIVAGSLLGVKLKRSHFSFPVGKVWIKYMYPMNFEEFLWAFKQEYLIEEIKKSYHNNIELIKPLHNEALGYYRLYLVTGGMPESVQNMVDNNKDISIYNPNILKNIVDSYFDDMNKYVESNAEALKIKATYNSIPMQLANNSKKFQYSKISTNARKRDYELVLDWLFASNMIESSTCLKKPAIPPELYKDTNISKVYLNDVGILNSIIKTNFADILIDNLDENKGIITENYVANELICNNNTLYYWLSSSNAEVDFVIYNNDGLIPIEVKSSENTQSKSLNSYIDKYKPKYAIRISSKNFGYDKVKNIKSVPLYAVFLI